MEVAQVDNIFDKFGCEEGKEREDIQLQMEDGFQGGNMSIFKVTDT